MLQITEQIMLYLPYILIIMSGFILIALIIFVNLNIKMSRLNKKYKKLMQGMEGNNLENILFKHIEEVKAAVKKVDVLAEHCTELDKVSANCIQYVGVVRFNAFHDTGSDLSFAIALLDAHKNGIVLSSLYGRNEARVYAKPILAGESSYMLTTEEKQAIEEAYKNPENYSK